jgi:cytochrome P450
MNPPEGTLSPKFDALDPGLAHNPYEVYARLRKAARVCRGGPGEFVITRHADVAALLDDGRLQSEFPDEYYRLSAGGGPAAGFLERIMLHRHGPRHRAIRRVLGPYFDAPALGRLRERITRLVDALLNEAADRESVDVVQQVAIPLTSTVMFEIMGVPVSETEQMRSHVLQLGRAFASSISPEGREIANRAITWLRDYAAILLQERSRAPRADLISHMIAGFRQEDGLGTEDIIDNIVFLLFAGFETTSSLISTGLAALLQFPPEWRALRSQPWLAGRAVEEFLRFDAPIQSRLRFVREPIEIDGRTIRPGRMVLLLLGSANHDEAVFAHPEQLDVSRNPNPHLSFGGGDHYCLGAGLGRLECKILLERMVTRFGEIEPAGESIRNVESPFRSYSTIPSRFHATA